MKIRCLNLMPVIQSSMSPRGNIYVATDCCVPTGDCCGDSTGLSHVGLKDTIRFPSAPLRPKSMLHAR